MDKLFENGTLLLNKYKIEDAIGKGGFGAVYKATDLRLRRTVAIKTLLHGQTSLNDRYGIGTYEEFIHRFEREAEISSYFTQNPHVITVYGLEQDNENNYYLVLEYLEGGSLNEYLRKLAKPLPIATVYSIAKDICRALTDIHNHPADIIHRDLKPANILLRGNGQAVVADFGVAQIGRDSHRTELHSASSRHPGSPPYKSPE
jgi:serine/threonine protein kinase